MVFEVTNTSDLVGDVGSLRWAIQQANDNEGEDTIVFGDALTSGAPTTIFVSTQFEITDDLIITGANNVSQITLHAQQTSRHFNVVTADVDLSLSGMTLSNGRDFLDGSGENFGGSIDFASGGTLTINAMRFLNNNIQNNTTSTSGGGAIAVRNGSTGEISNSLFQGNFALGTNGEGGAIYVSDATSSLTVTASTFTLGGSTGLGGAIRTYLLAPLTVTDSTFENNRSESGGGGAIATGSSEVTISNSNFITNQGLPSGATGASGGALLIGGGTTVIDRALFSNNSVVNGSTFGSQGGAIQVSGLEGTSFTLTNSYFVNNRSNATAGALDILGDEVSAVIENTTFQDNHANLFGGVIRSQSSDTTIRNSTIASNSTDGYASAVYLQNGGRIENSTIAENVAGNAGGAAIYSVSGTVAIANSIIADNSANGSPSNIKASSVEAVFSIIGDQSNYTLVGNSANNLIGVDPLLGTLNPNIGGIVLLSGTVVPTYPIDQTSPAFNAGDPNYTGPLDFDQRGSGFERVSFGRLDIGAFELQDGTLPPPPPPSGVQYFAVGADAGGGPHVKVYDAATQELVASFFAYELAFAGGVSVAVGDVDGDGVPDIITGAGAGGGPHVKVFSGDGFAEIASFFAYEELFSGGVFVAVGQVDGVGGLEIVTGAGAGGGPHVRTWTYDSGVIEQLAGPLGSFFAYELMFTGGVRVAVGNYDTGIGHDEIITGAGPGGGPHVRVLAIDGSERASFFAYDPEFRGGVYVAVGADPLANDGSVRILTGAGAGGGPHVKIWSYSVEAVPNEVVSTFVNDPSFANGIRVAAGYYEGQSVVFITTGPNSSPILRIFNSELDTLIEELTVYDDGFLGGVLVGAGQLVANPA
jgi:hypothetical protein